MAIWLALSNAKVLLNKVRLLLLMKLTVVSPNFQPSLNLPLDHLSCSITDIRMTSGRRIFGNAVGSTSGHGL